MSEDQNAKKKRAAKRYPYPLPAKCDIEGQISDVQLLNISTSGVQFASKAKIETKSPIKLTWTDPQYGTLEPTFLIAREIHKPENKDYQYYYGSQYYNLSGDTKGQLLVLLKKFKEEDKKENEVQVEKITPKYVLEVIDEGDAFLKRAFAGEAVPSYFDSLIKDIKEYEKLAFAMGDDVSISLQKITTHNFHFNLLGMLTSFMVEKSELQSTFFYHIQIELQKVAESEAEIEALTKKIMEGSGKDADKKAIQKKINESNNRLFYTKQGLLQSVVETFSNIDPDSLEFKETFGKIKEEFDRIQEFTNATYHEESNQMYARRSKKPTEYSKADAIVDLPIMSDTRPRYFLWFNGLLILIFGVAFGLMQFSKYSERDDIKSKIGLQIDIKEYKRDGTQFDLVVGTDEWRSLPTSNKRDVFEKIITYLAADRVTRSCILYDDRNRIIKILYEDTKLSAPGNVSTSPVQPKAK